MFTFKKIALVGVAGLAAFSMSCSDVADEAGGTWATPFDASYVAATERVTLSGSVTANTGNTISGVTVTSNNTPVSVIEPPITTGGATVVLDGTRLSGLCGSLTGQQTFAIKVVVSFLGEGDPLEGTKSVSFDCGGSTGISSWDFSLSTAAHSYADLDAKQTFSAVSATAAQNAATDIAAFYPGGGCTNGFICSTWVIATLTGESFIIPIPSTYSAAAKQALDTATPETLATFNTQFGSLIDTWTDEDSIAITDGEWFLVDSTEGTMFAVKIVSSTASSVNLKAISLF